MPSAGGIKAGAAYVELFVKDNRLVKGLDAASVRLKAFGAATTAIGAQLAGLGVATIAPFLLSVKVFSDMGSELVDMSQRTGRKRSKQSSAPNGIPVAEIATPILVDEQLLCRHYRRGTVGRD